MTVESINLKDIIIVPKTTKYVLDMNKYHLTPEEAIEKYKEEGTKFEDILASHNQQMESLEMAKSIFDSRQFVSWGDLTRERVKKAMLAIALGGDNHFLYVSHFVDKELIIGINSDPRKNPNGSEGALTSFTMNSFRDFLYRLKEGAYRTEEWTRLQIILNNRPISTLATGDVFIGESRRKMMSQYIIDYEGQIEQQKSSGVIVTTGAGSTCWYDSENHYLYPDGNKFSRVRRAARFLTTAPYRGKLTSYSLLEGGLEGNQELLVKSLNDHEGEVSLDSQVDFPFPRGSQVRVRIADQPLRVIVPS